MFPENSVATHTILGQDVIAERSTDSVPDEFESDAFLDTVTPVNC